MTIGEGYRRLREQRGYTQENIEELTGVKREYISRIENNHLSNITIGTLAKLLKAIKRTESYLYAYIGR